MDVDPEVTALASGQRHSCVVQAEEKTSAENKVPTHFIKRNMELVLAGRSEK